MKDKKKRNREQYLKDQAAATKKAAADQKAASDKRKADASKKRADAKKKKAQPITMQFVQSRAKNRVGVTNKSSSSSSSKPVRKSFIKKPKKK